MDAETMERLLIDRRLGELPPDTERLLDAYVHVAPGANAVMTELNDILDLAGRALREDSQAGMEKLPPLSIADALPREVRSRTSPSTSWARPISLAASIVLAFLLGTRIASRPLSPAVDQAHDIAWSSNAEPADTGEFWSAARYASDRADPPPSSSKRIEWTSPLVWPQLGEKL